MCTPREDERTALSRRGVLRGGALAALALVPVLGGAQQAAAGTAGADRARPWGTAAGAPGTWSAPLAAAYPVSAGYGVAGDWLAGHHTGIDFAVPSGTRVSGIGPGTVDLAREYGDYGNAVVVRMDDGHFVLFAHLSRTAVKPGERVGAGDRLGDSGATGRVTGPHLHFEVRTTRHYRTDIDPVAYLAARGVRLD